MRLELSTDLLSLLPPWYREVLDYAEICRVEEEEFTRLAAAVRAVRDNAFFQTMDAGACADWEAIFSIIADPTTETLEFRRARLISRISTRPPFTQRFLERKLDELIGAGKWTVLVDYPNYALYIELVADEQSYINEATYLVCRIKPAHIGLTVARRLESTGKLTYGAVTESAATMDVWPLVPRAIEATAELATPGALSCRATLEIYPTGGTIHA